MIDNLAGRSGSAMSCDVAIIGAGTIGLVIATALARKGLSVLCLESGDWKQTGDEHPLNQVVQTGTTYLGAAHGRFRGLGGTSTRWGGALIPFQAPDIVDANWPVPHAEIMKYCEAVEELFGLPTGSYDLRGLLGTGATSFVARLAKWPPFSKRNVFHLVETEVRSERGPGIVLNATVTDFRVTDGRLQNVVARSSDGARMTVSAREFVFAAGAIETTRLLLLLDRQNGGVLSRCGDQLGRNFHDHLSVMVGTFEVSDLKKLNRLVGFRFEAKGAMRNLRFELSENSPLRGTIPPLFAHIAFAEEQGNGFSSLRGLLRYAQQRRFPPLSAIVGLARSAPWLLRALWWRFFEKRLLYPDAARLEAHIVLEQQPRAENRISLSAAKVDEFAQPLAEIAWSVGPEDLRNIAKAAAAFVEFWNSSPFAAITRLVPRKEAEILSDFAGAGGIYHPAGSTRMAASPELGVVDNHLRVFGLRNATVASTSAFPTGGGANPTMMLLMLSLRLVDELSEQVAAQGRTTPAFAKMSAGAER